MSVGNGDSSIHVFFCRSALGSKTPANLARLEQRSEVHLEAVPCSGRTNPQYLLKAFEGGAKAVCILACPSGTCKNMEGNFRAVARVNSVRELLSEAGLDPNSVQIFLPNGSPETGLQARMDSICELVDGVLV